MRLSEAVELYLGDVARRCAPRTHLKYEQELTYFLDYLGDEFPVEEITPAQCLAHLNKWNDRAAKTKALKHTVLKQMFEFLQKMDIVPANPMLKIAYPKVPPAEDRGVKTMTQRDVQKMMQSCQTWSEKLAVGVLAYMGVRRAAANNLKWKDVDLELGYMTFKEKGQKTIRKPIPLPLLQLLKSYCDSSEVTNRSLSSEEFRRGNSEPASEVAPLGSSVESDYVIPSEGTLRGARNDRFIWRVVKRVGARAGVDTHCHAFRSAFAVFYLESNEGHLEGLQPLMGHKHLATTQGYLRRLNRDAAMEKVRTLDWGVTIAPPETGVSLTEGEWPSPAGAMPPGASVLVNSGKTEIEKSTREDWDSSSSPSVSEDDPIRRIHDDSGQKDYVPSKRLRGKDSNLDSESSKASSAGQRVSARARQKRHVSKPRSKKTT